MIKSTLTLTLALVSVLSWNSGALARDDSDLSEQVLDLSSQDQINNSSLYAELPEEVWVRILDHSSLTSTHDFRLISTDALFLSRNVLDGRAESDEIDVSFSFPDRISGMYMTREPRMERAEITLKNEQTGFSQMYTADWLDKKPLFSRLHLRELPLTVNMKPFWRPYQTRGDMFQGLPQPELYIMGETCIGTITKDMVLRTTKTGETANLQRIRLSPDAIHYNYASTPKLRPNEFISSNDHEAISVFSGQLSNPVRLSFFDESAEPGSIAPGSLMKVILESKNLDYFKVYEFWYQPNTRLVPIGSTSDFSVQLPFDLFPLTAYVQTTSSGSRTAVGEIDSYNFSQSEAIRIMMTSMSYKALPSCSRRAD